MHLSGILNRPRFLLNQPTQDEEYGNHDEHSWFLLILDPIVDFFYFFIFFFFK